MFGIGETELVIIVIFAFMLFGPDKLPGMGRTLGRVLRQFREASDGFTEVVQTNIMDPASEELEKSPKQRRREEEAQLQEDGASSAGEDAPAAEAPAPRRETFAERKARLAAERAAKEEQAAQGDAEAKESKEDEASDDAESKDADSSDAPTTAADLYALAGTQHSSRFRSAQTDGEEDGEL